MGLKQGPEINIPLYTFCVMLKRAIVQLLFSLIMYLVSEVRYFTTTPTFCTADCVPVDKQHGLMERSHAHI